METQRPQISGLGIHGGGRILTRFLMSETPKHFATKIGDSPSPFKSRPANNACGAKRLNPNTALNGEKCIEVKTFLSLLVLALLLFTLNLVKIAFF